MSRLYRILIAVCWGLGLLSMVAGAALKFAPNLSRSVNTEPRGGLVFAGVLFLCALATQGMERESPLGK